MATTKTDMANKALGHLGVSRGLSTYEHDLSPAGVACRMYYEDAIKATLRDRKWQFATEIKALQLVAENPNDEWGFAYRYPIACVAFDRILNGERSTTEAGKEPWRIIKDDTGEVILCNRREAQGEYSVYVDDPSRYNADFVLAASLRLASLIAPMVTGGDANGLGVRAFQRYQLEVSQAGANSANESEPDHAPMTASVRARR